MRLLFVLATLLLPAFAQAKSLALVIGNDAYQQIEPLQKARADANGYATLFGQMGIEVTLARDLTGRGMVQTLAKFYDRIAPGDTVLFVYSGHGWSDGQRNFLVPTDISATGSQTLLAAESFPVQNGANGILDEIAARGPRLTVAIIDACRNNPFRSADGTRAVGLTRGLVPVAAPSGTFIAFSAGEGQTALDRLSDTDPAPYSVFTRVFLEELAKPQDLQTAFKATQQRVNETAEAVGHPQRPAYYDEVIGSACLSPDCRGIGAAPAPAPPPAPAPAPVDRDAQAAAEWQDFKDTTSIAALEAFAERHADTIYEILARSRIEELKAAAQPAPPAPAPPSPSPPAPRAPDPAYRKPGWCPYAKTPTEVAICGNATLSGLDLEMVRQYNAALARVGGSGPAQIRATQKQWLDERDRCGANVACIETAYQTRIYYLRVW